jgi:hypothetical protein
VVLCVSVVKSRGKTLTTEAQRSHREPQRGLGLVALDHVDFRASDIFKKEGDLLQVDSGTIDERFTRTALTPRREGLRSDRCRTISNMKFAGARERIEIHSGSIRLIERLFRAPNIRTLPFASGTKRTWRNRPRKLRWRRVFNWETIHITRRRNPLELKSRHRRPRKIHRNLCD